jgi:hypothetical protein
MYQIELFYFTILAIVVITSEFLPSGLLMSLDHVIVRIGMVLLLLFLISMGPTAGIMGLMAIAILYLERNRRKVAVAAAKINRMDVFRKPQATVEQAAQPQRTVPVKPFDKPVEEESAYLPIEEPCDITNFEPVAPTINQKAVLASVYPFRNSAEATNPDLFEDLGVGHV